MTGLQNRLNHFPISFFSMVMGLTGLTISWQKAQHIFNIDLSVNVALLALTSSIFVVLLVMYGLKFISAKDQVMNEFHNPIKLNFFPTISISLLLLSIAFLSVNTGISHFMWVAGSVMHLLFTLYVVNAWIHHEHFEVKHVNPAWFIPAVGNVIVPIAGIPLGYTEVSWFFFSIGMFFWVILLTIIFYRLMFHNPMPEKLMPTLFILIAPPAVGFVAYMRLTGELDSFARVLYFSGLFLTLLLLIQVKRFAKLQFFLSWWAYSFPVAAITIASLLMYEITQIQLYQYIGAGLLALLTSIVTYLLIRTVSAVINHEICTEEH
ncbi:MAG: C4-dicarboxylate ABC transporter [endosymbiont of Galathealinum brachiosum]|uniref:C4-dicarboxylate ABC transporter n=1 Tax=endosymbiont of Galathealinum brachiosum TaxID=2200906 RepID=A0A370DPH5_9GAMM|nr:MAG: C4-dicarboxylate ABC transporter [endosymbiont of Galathealinum brachiosum]